MLVWDWAKARRVLDAWARWAAVAPDEVTSVLRLFRAPDVPWLPAGCAAAASSSSTERSSATRRGRRDHRAAAGAATRDRHLRRHPGGIAGPDAPGTGGSRWPPTPAARCCPGCRRTPSRRWWRRPARAPGRGCCSPRFASSAARCPARRRGAARWTGSTARSSCSPSAPDGQPGRLDRPARGRRPGAGCRAALGDRGAVPLDGRRPGRRASGGARPRTGDRLSEVRVRRGPRRARSSSRIVASPEQTGPASALK